MVYKQSGSSEANYQTLTMSLFAFECHGQQWQWLILPVLRAAKQSPL
ncbi:MULTISPECIES: hypothetical protein [unclassified Tolypothrix]|nr:MULTISPECIES: hypothetical protein [unclassified Tolypothrix]MBE9086442.1 hypothetical protein [Tolypothrix sp. LEGE 11397]UYD36004.1 hypothetical protein HG267_09770 [Tolypothrix sp. PCC 7601]